MPSFTPVQIAVLISAIVALVGIFLTLARRAATFAGYGQHQQEVRELASKLRGEISRDGPDLLISGRYGQAPAFVRFSNRESAPGVSLHLKAPTTFAFAVAPRSMPASQTSLALMRTGQPGFDSKYSFRTDQPTQARMLLNRHVVAKLQKLCCSAQTFVTAGQGEIELGEMMIPASQTAEHLWEHMQFMAELSEALKRMPNADRITVPAVYRERHLVLRAAVAVGAVCAVAVVIAASHPQPTQALASLLQPLEDTGIQALDLPLITQPGGWHAMRREEFSSGAVGFLRTAAAEPSGRITGDFVGRGAATDAAYQLANHEGAQRVVMIARGLNRLDLQFESMAFITRVRESNLRYAVLQDGSTPHDYDGDALLMVRNADDSGSGLLAYFSHGRLIVKNLADYRTLSVN